MTGPWSVEQIGWGEVPNLVLMWAEEVLRQVERVCVLRSEFRQINWAYDRLEDWSPTEERVAEVFRKLWTAEHTLVWSSYQLERWLHRDARDRGEQPPAVNQWLKQVRDALEHLDEARFENSTARPGAATGYAGKALHALPEQQMRITLGGDNKLFRVLDPDELERQAQKILDQVDNALMERVEAMLPDRLDE